MLQNLQGHWGFTRLPFGRDLAPSMLHRHNGHSEAAARITWAVTERALALVTGEVGVGKTVAVRAALARPRPSPPCGHLPGQSHRRRPRHPPRHRHHPRSSTPISHRDAHPTGHRRIGHRVRRARAGARPRDRRGAPVIPPSTRGVADVDQPQHGQRRPVRMPTGRRRHPVLRRRDRPDPPNQPWLPRAVNNVAIQALLAAFAEGKAIVDEHSTRTAVTEVTTE
jgi:hypothetical protein